MSAAAHHIESGTQVLHDSLAADLVNAEPLPIPWGYLDCSISNVVASGVTFRVSSLEEFLKLKRWPGGDFTYTRYANPMQSQLEAILAAALDAEAVAVFPSGMAAITTSVLALSGGDETQIIYSSECYRKTAQFFGQTLVEHRRPVIAFPFSVFESDWGLLSEALERKQRSVIFVETPSNPLLKLCDLERLAALFDDHREAGREIISIVDSTIATPALVNPRVFGADIEIHSGSKYLGGHDNLLIGVVAGPKRLVDLIRDSRAILGSVAGAEQLYKFACELETFEVRFRELANRGLVLAQFLDSQDRIEQVFYPGLSSSPYFAVARSWIARHDQNMPRGSVPFGGLVTFRIRGIDPHQFTNRFGRLGPPCIGVSFGGTHLVLDPFGLRMKEEVRRALRVCDRTFRLFVGLDHSLDDLKERFSRALCG